MSPANLLGDTISIIASLVAFSYVLGIWLIVHARSRMVLLYAMLYMVITRFVILTDELILPGTGWIETHRSLIIVPQYVMFAIAFAMTYYELREFRFDIPKRAEDADTEDKHLKHMEDLRDTTDAQEGEPWD